LIFFFRVKLRAPVLLRTYSSRTQRINSAPDFDVADNRANGVTTTFVYWLHYRRRRKKIKFFCGTL